MAVDLNGGKYGQVFSVAHTDPYFTADGVSRSFNASYIERDRITSSFSQFTTQTYSAGFGIGYPLSEEQFFNVGLTYSHEDLATAFSSSTQLRDWVRNNGDYYFDRTHGVFYGPKANGTWPAGTSLVGPRGADGANGATILSGTNPPTGSDGNTGDYYFRRVGRERILGTLLDTVEITGSWLYDSRNRSLFPTSGGSHRLSVSIAPPINDVSFVSANFRSQQFFHIPGADWLDRFPLSVTTNLGWSRALGDTTAVPPHRHVFMGGSDSVRGFRDGTLGPRDSLGNPYGGDAGLSAQFEAIIPLPAKFQSSARLSLFYDIGQSFYLGDTEFRNPRGDRTDYRFDLGELRSSAGIAVQWLSPMGLFRLSYAVPLRWQDATRREYGDDIEEIQFSVGNAF